MSVINPVVGTSIPSVSGRDASSSSSVVNSHVASSNLSGEVPNASSIDGGYSPPSTGSPSSPTKAQVNQALEDMIKRQPGATSVLFSIDENLNQMVIKVIDPTTNKVIKQIPAEAVLKMREDMLAMDSKNPPAGALLSEKT